MSTKEELFSMATQLKEYCESKTIRVDGELDCSTDCIFRDRFNCLIAEVPSTWGVHKKRRWTDEDIALAKALKAFGVTVIWRYAECAAMWGAKEGYAGELPPGSFADLADDEKLPIDDIIAEED